MSLAKRRERLRGIVASVVTPLKPNREIDYERFREQVRFIIDGGIREGRGLLNTAGGIGEGYFLREEEHKRIMSIAVDEANGQAPIMTGVWEISTKTAIERIQYADDVGVEYIQLNPPHYTRPTDDEYFRHVKLITESTEAGIVLYNTPWCAGGYEFTPALMSRMVTLAHVVGVKWTGSEDPSNFVEVLKGFWEKVNFICSPIEALKLNVPPKGYISLLANFAPEREVMLWDLLEKGEYERFKEEWEKVHGWRGEWVNPNPEIPLFGVGEGSFVKGVMEAVGRPMGPPFLPQNEYTPLQKESLKRVLRKYGYVRE